MLTDRRREGKALSSEEFSGTKGILPWLGPGQGAESPISLPVPTQAGVDSVSTSLSIVSLLQGNSKGGQGTDGEA